MNMVNNSYKIIGHNIFSYDNLKNLSEIYGNRFYIFLPEIIQKNYTELKNAFSKYFNTEVLYSVKTNYTPHLLKIFCDMGVNPEVVSELEVDIINKIGLKTDRLIVNGPIKTKNLIVTGSGLCIVFHRYCYALLVYIMKMYFMYYYLGSSNSN